MTTPIDRFERRLPDSLADLAAPRTPDYMIDILGQTARTRQRPAWTFPERWLPMADIARRTAFVPRLPMRAIILALVVVAILVAAGAVYVGSRHRLPAPFGLARNGLVAYADGGSVYTIDPASSSVRTVVAGDGIDVNPVFSPDGTKLLYEEHRGVSNGSFVVAADVDSGRPVAVSPHELLGVNVYGFSSDGRAAVINHVVGGVPSISVASTDGDGFRTLDLGMWAEDPSFRPGTSELIFVARGTAEAPGIYLVNDDGTKLRSLLRTTADTEILGAAQWSPDGTRLAYAAADPGSGAIGIHVMSADGTGDRVVGHSPGSNFEAWPLWAPDGKRLLIERGVDGVVHPTVVSVDGGSPDVVIDYSIPDWGLMKSWSPDGAFIQVTPQDQTGKNLQQLLWDTTTGTSTTAPWVATSAPTWQRAAP